MKVLMTSTRIDYNVPQTIRDSDSSRWTIINAVVEHGGTVDVREVKIGEDITGYDLVIVNANDPRGPKTQHYFGAMWATLLQHHGGPRVIYNWDHWDIRRIWRGILNEDPLVSPSGPRIDLYLAHKYAKDILDQVEMFRAGDWPPNMVCAFKWGDHAKLSEKTNLRFDFTFDPSMDQPIEWGLGERLGPTEKRRTWVLAALTNHSKWVDKQGFRWPVRYVGCCGQPKIPRDELVKLYARSWGVLSPGYYHVGSGYWRARAVHAVATGCVLYGDVAEFYRIPGWTLETTSVIERLDEGYLANLARQQHRAFMAATEKRDDALARIYSFLHREANLPRSSRTQIEMAGQTTLL